MGGMFSTCEQRSSQMPAFCPNGTVWTSKKAPVFLQINQMKLSSSASWRFICGFEQTMSKLGPTFGLAKYVRNSIMFGLMVLFSALVTVGISVVKS